MLLFSAGEGWAVGASVLSDRQPSFGPGVWPAWQETHEGVGELALSQHRARGDPPEGNSTTLSFGAWGSSIHFLGKSKEDEVARLEVLSGEGIGAASSRTL